MKSTHLYIKIIENEKTKVSLQLPIASLNWLETLIPETALEKIKKRGIDIQSLIKKVKATGYEPQEVFHLKDTPKSYLIWIK